MYHLFESPANLSIYQNIFKNFSHKITLSKNTFPKLLLQKIYFNFYFLNAPSKNAPSSYIPGLNLQSLKIKHFIFPFTFFVFCERNFQTEL